MMLGYKLHPGQVWKNEFLVAALEDIADLDLAASALGMDSKLSAHVVRELVVDDSDGFVFPLKDRYDKTNRTLGYF